MRAVNKNVDMETKKMYTKIVPEETKIIFALDCSHVKISIKECLKCFLVFSSF